MAAIPVVVAVVRDGDDRVLCIRRVRGSYQGQWALPGGKVEADEHLDEAAVREVTEEAGIDTDLSQYCGVVSELLREDDDTSHFMLHICELDPLSTDAKGTEEGEVEWIPIDELHEDPHESRLVPSDHRILAEVVSGSFSRAYRCVIDERGEKQELATFTHI